MPVARSRIAAAIVLIASSAVIAPAQPASPPLQSKIAARHRVVFQVDADDPNIMRHAISGSLNAAKFYAGRNEPIAIEIVANGTGIEMFREDTSPVKPGLTILRTMVPSIVFSVCGSTKQIVEQREGHTLTFVDGARVVPLGVGRIIELEEAGWSYVHA